ncbi:MAG: TRAP transporter substrate-binding protein DctP [Deltaproteobacteria bacterium]|nr:TRAP transporter substrate-binding protein DctP [Deltaproteobacteria bacterium]
MQRSIRAWVAGVTAVVASLMVTAEPAHAGKVKIKLATLAPQGSSWENLLLELGEKWKEQSNGDVELKVYSGGITGNEGDTVTKMGVGQVQAAAITIVGMRNIDPAPQAAGVPGLLTTDEEFKYVVEKMEQVWEKRLLEKGYVVLSWGDTGWIHFFAKKALRTPADAAGVKIFAWAGDPNAVEAWKASGFQPIVLSSTDMMTSLTTGMIESFAQSAIMANASRWYEQAKFMSDVPWGRLLTATLVKKEVGQDRSGPPAQAAGDGAIVRQAHQRRGHQARERLDQGHAGERPRGDPRQRRRARRVGHVRREVVAVDPGQGRARGSVRHGEEAARRVPRQQRQVSGRGRTLAVNRTHEAGWGDPVGLSCRRRRATWT